MLLDLFGKGLGSSGNWGGVHLHFHMCINLFETRENSHQCIVKFVSIIEQLETLHVFYMLH